MRILVFGGTGEAIDLANGLVRQGHQVTTSLAGVTRKPRLPNGHHSHWRISAAQMGFLTMCRATGFNI